MATTHIKCTKCGGDGIYKWGEVLNGVATRQGECWRCNGSGVEPVRHRGPEVREVPRTPIVVTASDGQSFDLNVFADAVLATARKADRQTVIDLGTVLTELATTGRYGFPHVPNVYAALLTGVRHAYAERFV